MLIFGYDYSPSLPRLPSPRELKQGRVDRLPAAEIPQHPLAEASSPQTAAEMIQILNIWTEKQLNRTFRSDTKDKQNPDVIHLSKTVMNNLLRQRPFQLEDPCEEDVQQLLRNIKGIGPKLGGKMVTALVGELPVLCREFG